MATSESYGKSVVFCCNEVVEVTLSSM